jgi:hypothetical protein
MRRQLGWRDVAISGMNKKCGIDSLAVAVIAVLILLAGGQVQAARIYKSIDAQGHITYSSTPPKEAVQTQMLDIAPDYDAGNVTAHAAMMEEIRALADQLQQDRKQREQARRQNQEDAAQTETPSPPQTVIEYYPVYPPRLLRPPRLQPRRHSPRHPRRQPTNSDQP